MHIRSLSLIAMTGILLSLSSRLAAQTAPCGINTLKLGGEKEEVRFIPAPLEYVQDSVKRALPSVAADLKTDQPGHIEAKIDVELWDAMKNRAFGSEGMKSNGAIGVLHIDLATASQDGAQGTTVKISFSKHGLGNGSYGGPLADETECLVKLLSPIDPTAHPTGTVSAMPQATIEDVNVKAGTPVKVALRERLYSIDFPKNASTIDVVLQVIEDVKVNGVTVVRKGALARGKITDWKGEKSFSRDATLRFVVQSVTAVDGQEIPLAENSTANKESSKASAAESVAIGGLLGGLLSKGKPVFVRAGTSWELPTSQDMPIKAQL